MPDESSSFVPPPPQPDPPVSAAPPPYGVFPPHGAAPPYYGYAYPAPGPYAAPQRHSGWFWVAICAAIVGLFLIAFVLIFAAIANQVSGVDGAFAAPNSIAVIDISGIIMDADKVNKQLERFGDDKGVKAIILHIDSPGGGAAASQEIYHEVLHIRHDKNKRVVASVESVGASGAYYIASACDRIYANPASVVGSIGVIMEWTNYGDLMRWAKLKNVVIHAGTLKDAGDPTRDMTPEEQAYFQSLVDNMYGQFVHDVAAGRSAANTCKTHSGTCLDTDDKIRPLATGQVWTGEQAVQMGLIDKIGGYRVALMDTAKSVGISGEPSIAKPSEKKGFLDSLTDDTESLIPNPGKILNQSPGFYFLWK
jgi:protease IV